MPYYVAEMWDQEGIHCQGSFDLIQGTWKEVKQFMLKHHIHSTSECDNIYGDRMYYFPKFNKMVIFRYYYFAVSNN
jgi:hypothetical protein